MRCGALATATSDRTSSGGTYYGVMEMSGNEYELCVQAGNAEGRSFTALQGDGMIAGNGEHDVTNWPNSGANLYAGIQRGGAYNVSNPVLLNVSGRATGALYALSRTGGNGGRGARTAE